MHDPLHISLRPPLVARPLFLGARLVGLWLGGGGLTSAGPDGPRLFRVSGRAQEIGAPARHSALALGRDRCRFWSLGSGGILARALRGNRRHTGGPDGVGTGDWGLGFGNKCPQSPIPSPQSPLPLTADSHRLPPKSSRALWHEAKRLVACSPWPHPAL